MTIESASRRRVAIALTLALLFIVPITAGCLSEEEPLDLSEWYVGMTIDGFDSNGLKAVNVTELLFDVRFYNVTRDDWKVQESSGFFKGDVDFAPIRIEARYDDGKNPVEDFPILGSSNVITGALRFEDDDMRLEFDGDKDLITKDRSIDHYPHDYERTVRISGDYGELRLYFGLVEPK